MAKKKKQIDPSMFWSCSQTLTHNCLFNIIVGNRGGGKTYGTKEQAIDNFIKRGEQFGYVRRYKDDLKNPMQQYFKDIENAYPDYEFKTDATRFYIRERPLDPKEKWTEKDVAGYGFVLSTASNKKSISYPNITMLIFDEFILDKGSVRYLKNEVDVFLNLYETIARPGTGHPRCVAFLLANAITITNPYFLYWDLKMPTKQDRSGKWIWHHPSKSILVEDVRIESFIDAKKNTEFGELISGTKYADYSIENKFFLDSDTFLGRKTNRSKYWFGFIYNNRKYGVWHDMTLGLMFVSEDIDPSCPLIYTLTLQDHQPNTVFLKNRSRATRFNQFLSHYQQGLLYFENMNIKNICYDILKMTYL